MNCWRTVVIAIVIGCLGNAQEALTNDSVVKMVKAGLSEDVILSMVRTQPGKYTVAPEQLIDLKSAGVPDRVVAAMVEKGSNGAIAGKASGATPAAGTISA